MLESGQENERKLVQKKNSKGYWENKRIGQKLVLENEENESKMQVSLWRGGVNRETLKSHERVSILKFFVSWGKEF